MTFLTRSIVEGTFTPHTVLYLKMETSLYKKDSPVCNLPIWESEFTLTLKKQLTSVRDTFERLFIFRSFVHSLPGCSDSTIQREVRAKIRMRGRRQITRGGQGVSKRSETADVLTHVELLGFLSYWQRLVAVASRKL